MYGDGPPLSPIGGDGDAVRRRGAAKDRPGLDLHDVGNGHQLDAVETGIDPGRQNGFVPAGVIPQGIRSGEEDGRERGESGKVKHGQGAYSRA
jgi:hypothetical protein